ncbi:hypothetical protein ACWY4P_25140 [Streptomyces sp. LZ34]
MTSTDVGTTLPASVSVVGSCLGRGVIRKISGTIRKFSANASLNFDLQAEASLIAPGLDQAEHGH